MFLELGGSLLWPVSGVGIAPLLRSVCHPAKNENKTSDMERQSVEGQARRLIFVELLFPT